MRSSWQCADSTQCDGLGRAWPAHTYILTRLHIHTCLLACTHTCEASGCVSQAVQQQQQVVVDAIRGRQVPGFVCVLERVWRLGVVSSTSLF